MTAIVAWAKANWRGLLAGLLVGAAVGWFGHQPAAPEIVEKEADQEKQVGSSAADTRQTQGPIDRDIEVKFFAPAAQVWPIPAIPTPAGPRGALAPFAPTVQQLCVLPSGQPGQLFAEEHIHEHVGPSETDTHQQERHADTEEHKLDLQITPVSNSRYSLFVGAQVSPDIRPAIGGAVRVGPVWLQAQVTPRFSAPLQSDVTVGGRIDF